MTFSVSPRRASVIAIMVASWVDLVAASISATSSGDLMALTFATSSVVSANSAFGSLSASRANDA